jgi:hypothetical protein
MFNRVVHRVARASRTYRTRRRLFTATTGIGTVTVAVGTYSSCIKGFGDIGGMPLGIPFTPTITSINTPIRI